MDLGSSQANYLKKLIKSSKTHHFLFLNMIFAVREKKYAENIQSAGSHEVVLKMNVQLATGEQALVRLRRIEH
jgi:hypothetical protein